MPFTFVHTADWQIGRPFRGFGDRLGAVLEDARLAAIERIAAAAHKAGAGHVLVAGDVFDAETLPHRTLWPAFERMANSAAIRWHLLPGNHDPARVGGLWHRLRANGVPSNIHLVMEAQPVEIEPGVYLLPAPLTTKSRHRDPTEWMDRVSTPTGALRIGLAHGSIYDFASDGNDATIHPNRARSAGLDYLALGDWHGAKRIGAETWYSGTPEPDRFGDPTSGQALVVRASAGQPPSVDAVRTGHFVWAEETTAISALSDLEARGAALVGLAPSADRLLLRLSIKGTLGADERAQLASWTERLEARLRYLSLDLTGLHTRIAGEDLRQLFSDDPRLGEVARRLAQRIGNAGDKESRIADRALMRLVEISRTRQAGAA